MAKPSPSNPLGYVVKREYSSHYCIKKNLLRERLSTARNLYRKDLLAHYGCVNAIEFSNKGELLASGGDDRRVLIWNVEQAVHGVCRPSVMRAQHISNIFCLGFDSTNSKVFSAGNDDQVIVHDVVTGDPVDYFLHEQPVYGLSIDPLNDNVFASACDDGRVLIYDIREPASSEPFCLASYSSSFHAVMFNPVEPRILTTANSKEGVGLWDVRKPKQVLLRYGGPNVSQSCMSVRFNQRGTCILALRRRLPPVLYAVHSAASLCQFDHPGYYNSCTMKSCCFAGEDDQYVMSGSDDFNLYVWQIPPTETNDQWVDQAHMILQGHRSIVNQVRFNASNCIIASSGVEKLIKFWSPFPLPESTGGLVREQELPTKQRRVFTHEEYISLVLRSGQFMSHDYSHQSTKEDPRMMAFFDSLVQREIEGWSSEDSVGSELSATNYQETIPDLVQTHSDSEFVYSDGQGTDQPLTAAYTETIEAPVNNNNINNNNNATEHNAETSRTQTAELELPNRISELIARKRVQLMRLARSRAYVDLEPSRTSGRHKPRTREHSSDSSDSGRVDADTVNNNNINNSNNTTCKSVAVAVKDSLNTHQNGKASSSSSSVKNMESKTNNNEVRKRRLKYLSTYSDSSEDEDWTPKQKKKKLWWETESWQDRDTDSDGSSDTELRKISAVTKRQNKAAPDQRARDESSDDSNKDSDSETSKARSKRKSWLYRKRVSRPNHVARRTKSKEGRKRLVGLCSDLTEVSDSSTNEEDCNKVPTSTNDGALVGEGGITTTPSVRSFNGALDTPDSGIAVATCSSAGSTSQPGSSNGHTSDNPDRDWVEFELFKSRIDRTRRNYRKHMGDCDSN